MFYIEGDCGLNSPLFLKEGYVGVGAGIVQFTKCLMAVTVGGVLHSYT